MPTFAELTELHAHPEPAYPEYGQLRAQAQTRARGVAVGPAEFRAQQAIIGGHSADWCTAVLGRPYEDLRGITVADLWTLVLADQAGLDPPLPARIRRWREEDQQIRARQEARREEARRRDQERSRTALDQCPVPVEVRPNVHGRRGNSLFNEPLAHIVPLQDAVSGRSRRHLAGRGLCEAVGRPKPLEFGEPGGIPATCKSCLNYAPQIRPATPARGRGDFPAAITPVPSRGSQGRRPPAAAPAPPRQPAPRR